MLSRFIWGQGVSLRNVRSLLPSIGAVLLVTAIVLGEMPPPIAAPAVARAQEAEKGRDVIVVLKRGADARSVARGIGAHPTHLYDHVIDGFAATLPPQALRGLENHPTVLAVVPDRLLEAFTIASPDGGRVAVEASQAPRKCKKIEDKKKRQQCIKKAKKQDSPTSPPPAEIVAPPPAEIVAPPLAPVVAPPPAPVVAPPAQVVAPPPVVQPDQEIPTGVNRVDADQNAQAGIGQDGGVVAVDVAVLDTGIAAHPDLTIAGGHSCLGQSYGDDHRHGTHVAGSIAALDNAIGVVGVAPGARLWAIKVLDAQGNGSLSSAICGLEWVYANRGTIDVVNLSLGGSGADSTCSDVDPLHKAICRVVNDAGIPVVVAAGNKPENAANVVPATYEEVIAVSAFADTDGAPGGQGPSRCANTDDTFASISNFGPDVDIAAPGVCIRSTSLNSGYAELSGTSMAAPHVTGAVALYLTGTPDATPLDVRTWLLGPASRQQTSPEGFSGDPDTSAEPALYLGPT